MWKSHKAVVEDLTDAQFFWTNTHTRIGPHSRSRLFELYRPFHQCFEQLLDLLYRLWVL